MNAAGGLQAEECPRRRHILYQAIPQSQQPPCLAYKFGAPDGIDRRDVEELFEPRDESFRETESYGDTFVLPGPQQLD
ncbi:unnamed protein product [Heligmosomoides polygyrus]|uniref:AGC-kinase C-terminal domain-containing protein n=1 Tax=Heligmosomoides polygyrus TaxID=6339 RepID=A0A183G5Q9_HELPZ|nr:unnamed protein product [Heligmosomoides polygyrus]